MPADTADPAEAGDEMGTGDGAGDLDRPHQVVAALAQTRDRLRVAAWVCLLLVVPVEAALLGIEAGADDYSALRVRIPEVWIGRVPALLAVPAAVLALAALAVRWLPFGREAAALAPMSVSPRWAPNGYVWNGERPSRLRVIAGLVMVLFGGPILGSSGQDGLMALTGQCELLTVGKNLDVVERRPGTRTTVVVGFSRRGSVVLEGGSGAPGEEYCLPRPSSEHAFRTNARGYAVAGVPLLLGLGLLVVGGTLLVMQLRRAGPRHSAVLPEGRGKDPRVARVTAYRAGAAAVAVVSALGVLAVQVSRYHGHGELAVPALAAAGVASSLTVHAGLPAMGTGEASPPQEVRSADTSLRVRSTRPTRLRATVHRYATPEQAAVALTAWQRHQDDLDRYRSEDRVVLADGIGAHDPSSGTLRLARSRGPLLLVLELHDDTLDYRDTPARSRERLMAAAPAAVGILFDAAPALFDVTLVWWA